jgi:hypothetical protein
MKHKYEVLFDRAMTDDVLETLPDWAREIVEDLHGERTQLERMRTSGHFRHGLNSDLWNEYQESIEEYERLFRVEVVPLLEGRQ